MAEHVIMHIEHAKILYHTHFGSNHAHFCTIEATIVQHLPLLAMFEIDSIGSVATYNPIICQVCHNYRILSTK